MEAAGYRRVPPIDNDLSLAGVNLVSLHDFLKWFASLKASTSFALYMHDVAQEGNLQRLCMGYFRMTMALSCRQLGIVHYWQIKLEPRLMLFETPRQMDCHF